MTEFLQESTSTLALVLAPFAGGAVGFRLAIWKLERDIKAWERSYYELKAAADYHDSYCRSGKRI